MPASFPCPNPACSHTFAPQAVQGAVSLKCPRCGTVFQFRNPSAPPKPGGPATPTKPAAAPTAAKALPPPTAKAAPAPAPPAAKAPPPVANSPAPPPRTAPAARPAPPLPAVKRPPPLPPAGPAVARAPAVPIAVPVAAVVDAPPSVLAFSEPNLHLTPRRPRGGVWHVLGPVLVAAAVGAFIIASVVGGLLWLRSAPPPAPTGDAGFTAEDAKMYSEAGNFRLTPPPAAWKIDHGLQNALRVNLAMHRDRPNNTLAVFFRDSEKPDSKGRLPSDAELIDEAVGKLRVALTALEYEPKPRDPAVTLGGQPALRMEFQGEDREHVLVNGEVLMLAYRGWGYWFFTWGPLDEHDQIVPEWKLLREGFALESQREGWKERPKPTTAAVGKALPYRLEFADDVWTKVKDAEKADYDARADLVLIGHDPKDKDIQSAGQRATVQALALDKADDLKAADKAARDYLLEKMKEKQKEGMEYNYPNTTIEVTSDKSLGHNADNDCDVGGFRGHVAKLEVKNTPDRKLYVVLAVVRMDDGVLAVVCECAWDRRDFWEQEFTPLLDKLKPAKGR